MCTPKWISSRVYRGNIASLIIFELFRAVFTQSRPSYVTAGYFLCDFLVAE